MLNRVPTNLPPEIEAVMNRAIGAAIEVHRHLGPGFLESIYRRAMCVELKERGMPFKSHQRIQVSYKGLVLKGQQIDLIVDSCVIVEIKAVSQLEEIHGAQLLSYLKATGLRAGLLMNFNKVVLKAGLRRIVL